MGEPPILGLGMPIQTGLVPLGGNLPGVAASGGGGGGGGPGELWITETRLLSLPTSGTAWNNLESAATGSQGSANLADMNNKHNTKTFAKALYAVRTNDATRKTEVRSQVMSAINTENGGRTLALGRNLLGYVLAADLVGLTGSDETTFRSWLSGVRGETLDSRTLISTHEVRPNNWGTHAGASRLAASLYINDASDVARHLQVFKGWLGDRSSYNENSNPGFTYGITGCGSGDCSWQSDANNPVGINPVGATLSGHNADGILPDDQRRCGTFVWPPCQTIYAWEGLQGIMAQAVMTFNQGFDVWNFENRAIVRALDWLHDGTDGKTVFTAAGDDRWQPWIVNFYNGTSFPAPTPTTEGKNMGFTDWTHA